MSWAKNKLGKVRVSPRSKQRDNWFESERGSTGSSGMHVGQVSSIHDVPLISCASARAFGPTKAGNTDERRTANSL